MNKQIKKWQKKFEKEFGRFIQPEHSDYFLVKMGKDFLAQAIQESVVEAVESLRMREIDKEDFDLNGITESEGNAYNQAVSEFNSKIDKLTK